MEDCEDTLRQDIENEKRVNVQGHGSGTGALTAVAAVGMQDTFLTNDINSYFEYSCTQHSNFTKFHAARVISRPPDMTAWPFDRQIMFDLDPKTMGDLLCNMYLMCSLPRKNNNYCKTLTGRAMIKKIDFQVDDIIIETINGDWNVIYDEMFLTNEERAAYNNLIDAPNGGDLVIPLNLFFCRKHSVELPKFRSYFLTCAILMHKKISVTITFQPASYFCLDITDVSMPELRLVTEEITLTADERRFIQNTPRNQTISLVRNNPTLLVDPVNNPGPFNNFLVPNIPVKAFYWFFRSQKVETSPNFWYNRYNFCTNTLLTSDASSAGQEQNYPVVAETFFYLNGRQQLGLSRETSSSTRKDGSYYYKFLQPMAYDLNIPRRNIYMYSYCLNPKEPAPTGSVDFSKMSAQTSKLTGSIYLDPNYTLQNAPYNMYVYYQGYQRIRYENGFISVL